MITFQLVLLQELKLPTYKGHSPQLNLRRYYTDLIAVISNHFRLCPTARHLAVYLLDLFMDRYDVTEQQLAVVSLSCLLLASTFETTVSYYCSLPCVCHTKDMSFCR